MRSDEAFCGYPEAVMLFGFVLLMTALLFIVALTLNLWLLISIPILWGLYLWFSEGIEWKGRTYGHGFMPRGSLSYSGEKYECHSCKHIQDQLDCRYGCLVNPVKFVHKDDWRGRYPCSMCWRSGAITKQDLYKGPVRWAEGERP